MPDPPPGPDLARTLADHHPRTAVETADVARLRAAVSGGDPWARSSALHVTASAFVVHPPTAEVLLRWHPRLGHWLQVGGHGDPDETLPASVALREAREETGLTDLAFWPDPGRPHLLEVVIVSVPAAGPEPAHEHGDLRYLLATAEPAAIRPETPDAPLRWLGLPEAAQISHAGLNESLDRVSRALDRAGGRRRTPVDGSGWRP